jgi:hypothetical protein
VAKRQNNSRIDSAQRKETLLSKYVPRAPTGSLLSLAETTRAKELAAILERGNHKLAQHRAEQLAKALSKDVLHGFSLPILPKMVQKIVGAMAQPLGVAEQLTLTESGEQVL